MNYKVSALKYSFLKSIPIMCGYIFLGISFGILLSSKGFGVFWALFLSLIVYSGSAQFLAIEFLSMGTDFLSVAIITFLVSVRHIFYGLSMIDNFKDFKISKLYMIFSLTDETYSVLCSSKVPENIDKKSFMMFVSVLNHFYWILGSLIGSLAGSYITFDTTGIDFSMTSLFVIIFIEQWYSYPTHIPAVTGIVVSLMCLLIFGKSSFILFSMIVILIVFFIGKETIENKFKAEKGK